MNIAKGIQGGYEVNKTVIFSTGHVTGQTMSFLEQRDPELLPLVYYDKAEYGYFIVVPYDDMDLLEGIPEDLAVLLRIGAKHDAYYIEIDQDGPVYPNLKTYEW